MPYEEYRFMMRRFNVTKALEMIEEDDVLARGPLDLAPGAFPLLGLHALNEEYANEVTEERMQEPLILVRLYNDDGEQFSLVIDGWHRIWKAKQLGIETLPAVLIDGRKVDVT